MSSKWSRRHFLQATGATLAALGWSQRDFAQQGDRYGTALAQSTPRKLALLVGVNAYPVTGLFPPLYGCVNDVELQYHLLVHRFGFNPNDIVKLIDQQATRTNILQAFEEHLIQQAQPGDVVVFHFSGHGSRVVDPDRDFPDGLNSTLVPIDSLLPAGFPRTGGPVKDISGHTLFLLGSALQTDNVTMVLDCCHSGGAKRGNLIIRARPGGAQLSMSDAELAYQDQWRSRLNWEDTDLLIQRRRQGIAKGVAIAGARRDEYAADMPFQDFYAGAFTFALTQYLWQQTGQTSVETEIANVGRTTTQLNSSQQPEMEVAPNLEGDPPIYFIPKAKPPAEAVITQSQGDTVDVWLGGVNPRSLEVFGQGAVLAGVDDNGRPQGLVQITERQGLVGRGRLLETALPAGVLLQEQVRGIPTNVTLRIGLDDSLGNEQTAARMALANIPSMEPMALGQEEVHYVLGRMTGDVRQILAGQLNLPVEGSVGLFSQGLEWVPGSFGVAGESVPAAVERLRPKLRSLLAARTVKLILNPGSSRLNLTVTMIPETGNQVLASAFTVRSRATAPPPSRPGVEQLPLNTAIRFEIENLEVADLYLSVLVIDAVGDMAVVFPNQWTTDITATLLPAQTKLLLPDPSRDNFRLVTQEPKGATEVLIIASSQPLETSLRALQTIAATNDVSRGPVELPDPNPVVRDLLADVSRGTPGGTSTVQPVNASQLAALSITFDII
jgi:hypothetical protein